MLCVRPSNFASLAGTDVMYQACSLSWAMFFSIINLTSSMLAFLWEEALRTKIRWGELDELYNCSVCFIRELKTRPSELPAIGFIFWLAKRNKRVWPLFLQFQKKAEPFTLLSDFTQNSCDAYGKTQSYERNNIKHLLMKICSNFNCFRT